MVKTRNGIYYNLKKSEYTIIVNDIKYFFSSQRHLEKFQEQLEENREILAYSLFKRFKVWVEADELFDLVLYNKIESRGFLVEVEGVDYDCLESLRLDGVRKIRKR